MRSRILVGVWAVIGVCVLAVIGGNFVRGGYEDSPATKEQKAAAGDEQAPAQRDFMHLKLNHSHKILEGLVVEDYEMMAKHSQLLSLLSLDASWKVFETMEYNQQSAEFRRAADSLTAAAKKKNLDGAALAYVEVTMKCVNCHKYVRDTRRAAAGK